MQCILVKAGEWHTAFWEKVVTSRIRPTDELTGPGNDCKSKTGNVVTSGVVKYGHHFFPSLKLTFPFLFNLHDVQATLDFKSTSTKQRF